MLHDLPVASRFDADTTVSNELWNWTLRRQGLCDRNRLDSVPVIAETALGLHAARLPSPFATVLARACAPTVAMGLFTREIQRHVTTVRCMRKTLHTLPLALAAAAHAATVHFRERDALRAIHHHGARPRVIEQATHDIIQLLADKPLPHRQIETALAGPRRNAIVVRLALKLAWERGTVTYLNAATGWNKEKRTFGVTQIVYPDLDMGIPREAATRRLVNEYFDRYGPATIRDVTWWSGLSASAVGQAMRESGHTWIQVQTPWTNSPLYMRLDRLEDFQRTPRQDRVTGLNFLAHEDVAVKAYAETRSRYLDTFPATAAFNQIGEALPTIALNGKIIGTWSWHHHDKHVVPHVKIRNTRLAGLIRRQASALTDALRLGLVSERS